MDVSIKSTAVLMDELFTILLRCWWYQEVVTQDENVVKVARAAKLAQDMNARRSALIRAIDERLGEGEVSVFIKSYDREEIGRRFDEVESEFEDDNFETVNASELIRNGYGITFSSDGVYPVLYGKALTDERFNSDYEAWKHAWWHYRLIHVQETINIPELVQNGYGLEFNNGKFYPTYNWDVITQFGSKTEDEAWQQAWQHYRLAHVQT